MSLVIQQGVAADDPYAVFIMGPTATGKTDLAIALAEELPLDIISVDSAMVYRCLLYTSDAADDRYKV